MNLAIRTFTKIKRTKSAPLSTASSSLIFQDGSKIVQDIWYAHKGGVKTFSKSIYCKDLTVSQRNDFYCNLNDKMVEYGKDYEQFMKSWTPPWNTCGGLERLWGESIYEMVDEYMRSHKEEMPGFSELVSRF